MSDIAGLQRKLATFADARDWDQFHTPKNLVMALASEVGELCDVFRWVTPEQSYGMTDDARSEIGDVAMMLFRLADVLDVDIPAAVNRNLELHELCYSVGLARGNAIWAEAIYDRVMGDT